jgi:hypothetical protein
MNFEDLGKKVKKFSQDTLTEVQRMNEVRQTNSRISEEKKQIAVLYSQIGQKLYDRYKNEPLEGFEREFQELEKHYAEIEVCKDQVRQIRGVRVCPNCHTEVSVTERFCSSCGEKLPEILHIEEDEEGNTVIDGAAAEVVEEAEMEQTAAEEESQAEADVTAGVEAEAETDVTEEAEAEAETDVTEEAEAEAETDVTEEVEAEAETDVTEEAEADVVAEVEAEAETAGAEAETIEEATESVEAEKIVETGETAEAE